MPPFFDLASLTKPLVTAPLALTHLELDLDRRAQLGFTDRSEPLTVRQLLSHSAGLPSWLPFTGEPLANQLKRGFPVGQHPLLQLGETGQVLYSDLGYRLLADLLEMETGRTFSDLGAEHTGLCPCPWETAPVQPPDGPDTTAWGIAEPEVPLPPRSPLRPHDANARAGMRGHAGFGATPESMQAYLARWAASPLIPQMAAETAHAPDGAVWGLGLHQAFTGSGRFGELLAAIPVGTGGIHVVQSLDDAPAAAAPIQEDPGPASAFWMHTGYTGPALFIRPSDRFCLCLLLHRRASDGTLLDQESLRAKRWRMLHTFLAGA